jgi:hypothetical protein
MSLLLGTPQQALSGAHVKMAFSAWEAAVLPELRPQTYSIK